MPLREANFVAALDISDLYTASDATAVFADGIRLDQNATFLGECTTCRGCTLFVLVSLSHFVPLLDWALPARLTP